MEAATNEVPERTIAVTPELPLADLTTHLASETAHLVEGARFLVLGVVESPPERAVEVELEWGSGTLAGLLVPGDVAEQLMERAELHGLGTLYWRNARLEVGHPSGPGTSPLPNPDEAEARAEAGSTLGMFVPDGREPATAAEVLGALNAALPLFRFVVWPLAGD